MNENNLIWITKVEQKGNKYLVYVNDSIESITFNLDQLVEYHIVKGNSFYPQEWDKIINSLDFGKILDKTLYYIDYKFRTKQEIINYLNKNNVSISIQDEIINKLISLKYIDDEKYSQIYIEEKINSLMGPKVIKYNLNLKGINQNIYNPIIDNIDSDVWINNAILVANKTLNTIKGYPLNKQKETVYTRLSRMGYSNEVINKTISKVEYSTLDIDILNKQLLLLKNKGLDKTKIISKLLSNGYTFEDLKPLIDFDNDLQGEA